MESPRALDNRGNETLSRELQSKPELPGHLEELTRSGHYYCNSTAQDNARVQYGDQYNCYHAGSTGKLTLDDTKEALFEQRLEALAFSRMALRFTAIPDAYSSTCQWLSETPQFVRWRNRALKQMHHGLFWLKGKPGSGKSTVTKSAVEYARRTFTDEKTICFFFNARGVPLEKTVQGMYRSLLHQMSHHARSLIEALASEEVAGYSDQGWPSDLLSSLFRQAVCKVSKDVPLTCYIDALDEGDEDDVREMVDLLEELLEHAVNNDLSFSVYLASRHYPNIYAKHSEEFLLDDYDGHREDISTYVLSKLRCKPASVQRELAAEVIRRSSDVFLWVVLVIYDLNKQSDKGNHHRLRSHLQCIPSGLNDLFQRMVREGGLSEYTLPALQIVMFAHETLGPLELYFAILSTVEPDSEDSVVWNRNVVDEQLAIDFIISSSKGLLEVVLEDEGMSDVAPEDCRRSVQFIHESVREFLLNSGLKFLDPTLGENTIGDGNLRLARCCQAYLNLGFQHFLTPRLDSFGEWAEFANCSGTVLSSYVPFFSYAWNGVLLHGETAARHGVVAQEPLEVLLRPHLLLYWDRSSNRLSRIKPTPTVLHILASVQCANLISQKLKFYPPHQLPEYISAGCPEGYEKSTLNRTALQIAVSRRFPDIVGLLLSHGADVNVSHQEGDDHVLHIVTSGYLRRESEDIETIKVLLRYGADVDVSNNEGQTALHTECANGGVKIVALLLLNGANPNAEDLDRFTPLHMATYFLYAAFCNRKGSFEIIQTLLRYGADVNARTITGDTALHNSVRWNFLRTCKLLLEHGADVNARDGMGTTPLHQAARFARPSVACSLLQFNADIDACDDKDNTPLRFAIQRRSSGLVSVLLLHGAEVSSLYTQTEGRASFMDLLTQRDDRVAIRLITHCKYIPPAARFQAESKLEEMIFMMEGRWKKMSNDLDFDELADLLAKNTLSQVD
jgi:ankyrin repeat protein